MSFRILTFLATQSLLEIELNAQRWDVLDIGGKDLFPIGISDNKEILARGIKPNSFGAHAQTWLWLPESKNGLPQGWNEIGTSFEFSVEPESISSNGIVAGRYGLISNGVLKGVFIWKEGVLETFSDVEGLIIGRQSDERVFVNADGTVVGVVETGAGTGGQVNPESLFIRTADGQFTIIDNPSLFDDRIRATGINDTGNIIGWYWDHWEDRRIRAAVHFFWDGTMQKITENIVDLASGTGIAYPYDLSNANEVI
ncbi:MAG: hypothetical protein KJT03_15815, partial [Verrucomicrobiae bacterium]|nr:hypothetical protein [Verrucomicrobiae bacterium]